MRRISFLLIALLLTTSAFAETIKLKSGKVIEGKITEKTDEYVKINAEGQVLKIKFRFMDKETAARLKDYQITEEYIVEDGGEIVPKEAKLNSVDCGIHKEVIKFMPKLQDFESNPTLECLGRNILNGCNAAHGIINEYFVGTVKYELLGGSEEECKIQIEFDKISEQTEVSTDIDYTIYSGTDFQCDVSVGWLKKIWANSDFNGDIEKITPGFLAYSVYKYAFMKVRDAGGPSCSGSAVDKTDYSLDEGFSEEILKLEEKAKQEKVKKDIERKNNSSNVKHCGALNNMHIFALPEERADDENDAISCFNENLLACIPVTFDIVGMGGVSYEIKRKQEDFCLIDNGTKTCKIPVNFILESAEAAKEGGKPELAFLSVTMGMSFGKLTNTDTGEEIIIECD